MPREKVVRDACKVKRDSSPGWRLNGSSRFNSGLVRGYCIQCNRQVGGFRGRIAWQCPGCRKLYCDTCPKRKVGRFFKKLVCPECRIEMHEGGIPVLRNV
jgi:hypothetical protein